MSTIRPPVKWPGGKHQLGPRIIRHFPSHKVYLEAFGGGASILLNKPPAEVETYNDLDHRISRLFRVLRDQGTAFVDRVQLIPYSQVEFEWAANYPENGTDLDIAICDFVRWRQSFGGIGQYWSYSKDRVRGEMAGDVNAWWNAIEMLPEIIARLRCIQIACQPAIEAIRRFDHPEGLIYCDPPRVQSTPVGSLEMSNDDHVELAVVLQKCISRVIISGNRSPLYDRLYADWKTIDLDTVRLWINF